MSLSAARQPHESRADLYSVRLLRRSSSMTFFFNTRARLQRVRNVGSHL